jgi:D-glycero-beta-D-manno-heptose 1-phosphate adenylyltransferase
MAAVLTREALAALVAERQQSGQRAVLTNGVFDLLHLGHVTYLQRARALGDFLVVGLNSDTSARRLKGPRRPLVPEAERTDLLAALTCVDYVTVFKENTAEALVAALRPAIYAKGGDYAGAVVSGDILLPADELRRALVGETDLARRLPEAPVVAAYGGALALLEYLPGHSTTELIERIVQRYGEPEAGIPGSGGPDER